MENILERTIVERIAEDFERKIVFFVGAGISVPSGVPDFKKLNKEVIRVLTDDESESNDCLALSDNIRPEVMYQIAIDELGPEALYYSLDMLEGGEPNSYHYFLAEAIRRGNWVFTTNPDNLIENACKKKKMRLGMDFKTYYGRGRNDEDFQEFLEYIKSGSVPGACIFKLHGNIEEGTREEKYQTVRFALRQIGIGLFGPRREILEYFLKNFDFCFIGYRCRDDFSVYPVLSGTKSNRDIFWFRYSAGSINLYAPEDDTLLREQESEENKPLDTARNLDLLNINEVLLRRNNKFVIVGNPFEFIRKKLAPRLGVELPPLDEEQTKKKEAKVSQVFLEWAKSKDIIDRHLFLGRLLEQVGNLDKAIQFYNRALDRAKDDLQRIKVKRRLADLYYKQTIPRKEEEAIALYEQCINSSNNPVERASLKARISNIQRRRGKNYFSEAYKRVEEAKSEFEVGLKKRERSENLDYAACLNIYGLALYSLDRLDEARDFCAKSIMIKESLGDVDGIAESENAISLAFTQEGRRLVNQGKREESKEKFSEAIKHAKRALDFRRRIGNSRGYAQNCRNLAWPNSELMKLALREEERQKYFADAREGYKAGISTWDRFNPPPAAESVLYRNLLAGLYIDFCSHIENREQKEKWAQEVIPIYRVMFADPQRKQVAKSDPRIPTAKQNLEKISGLFKEIGLYSTHDEIECMLKELRDD